MIDDITKNRILDTAQILDVVSDFVSLRKRGTNYVGLCPFHNERTPSFNVNPARNIFHCFGCGKGGDPVHFLMEHEQLTFPEALRWLANKYGIEVVEKDMTDEERQAQDLRASLFIVNDYANHWFQNQLLTTPHGNAAGLAYFRSRGFRDDTIRKFQLGYSPDRRDALTTDALTKGYRKEFLAKTVSYMNDKGDIWDRFSGRVIFPIHTLSGKVEGFGGRFLGDAKAKGTGKYVNSAESEIYVKREGLYGIYFAKQAIVKHDKVYLVEGYADVISMHQSGVENVVASSGTSLTTGQIRMMHRFSNNVTVLYDGDSAGIHASLRSVDMLLEEGMAIKIVLLPDGEDPDSFARSRSAEEFKAYLDSHEVDFIRFKTDLLLRDAGDDPFKRGEVIKNIVESISVIPEAIIRSTYLTACSQMMHIEERILIAEVDKLRRKAWDERQKQRERAAAAHQSATSPDGAQPLNSPSTPADVPVAVELKPMAEGNVPNGNGPTSREASGAGSIEGFGMGSVSPDSYPLYNRELLLVQEIIRNGSRIVCTEEAEDGSTVGVTVADYIVTDLLSEGIPFSYPLFATIMQEVADHLDDPDFDAERFLMRHPNPQISNLSMQYCGDRYNLSRIYTRQDEADVSLGIRATDEQERQAEIARRIEQRQEKELQDRIPHLINDYKLGIVEQRLRQTLDELKRPEIGNDPQRSIEVMRQYNALLDARKALTRSLGTRVVS